MVTMSREIEISKIIWSYTSHDTANDYLVRSLVYINSKLTFSSFFLHPLFLFVTVLLPQQVHVARASGALS